MYTLVMTTPLREETF